MDKKFKKISQDAYTETYRDKDVGKIQVSHALSKYIQYRTVIEVQKRIIEHRGKTTDFTMLDILSAMRQDLENKGEMWGFND